MYIVFVKKQTRKQFCVTVAYNMTIYCHYSVPGGEGGEAGGKAEHFQLASVCPGHRALQTTTIEINQSINFSEPIVT